MGRIINLHQATQPYLHLNSSTTFTNLFSSLSTLCSKYQRISPHTYPTHNPDSLQSSRTNPSHSNPIVSSLTTLAESDVPSLRPQWLRQRVYIDICRYAWYLGITTVLFNVNKALLKYTHNARTQSGNIKYRYAV